MNILLINPPYSTKERYGKKIAQFGPTTELFELAQKDGTLKSFNWEDYRTWASWAEGELVYVPRGRSSAELKDLQKQALRQFYLRPKVILRFLKRINSFDNFKKYLAGAWVLLTNLKKRENK